MPDVRHRMVIVVDDGLATGATAAAAIEVLRRLGAGRIVLAVPVGAADSIARMRALADEVVCLEEPPWFSAVGAHYEHFEPTTDDEVVAILNAHRSASDDPPDDEVAIPVVPGLVLPGQCVVPPGAIGVVAFAHGSGSSRFSPRNRAVARTLNEAGVGTLLFDLLTEDESLDRANVFDIELLASRLGCAKAWLERTRPALPIGYFGASTGAGAALVAAAMEPTNVRAVVSRGGRPDLAGRWLPRVQAPTLLIVGGHDWQVIDLNRQAQAQLTCPHHLAIVPGATHLFEEPGTLDEAAQLAAEWFVEHLG